MKAAILFLLLLAGGVWLSIGADWIQTADDAYDAFCGLAACLCGLLLALVFVYIVAAGQARRVRQ
jgi:hypothetical protein